MRAGRAVHLLSVAPVAIWLCFDGGVAFRRRSDPWIPDKVHVGPFQARPFGLAGRERDIGEHTLRYVREEFRGLNVRVVTSGKGLRSAIVVFFGGRDFTRRRRVGVATHDPGNAHRNNYAFVFTDDVARCVRGRRVPLPFVARRRLRSEQVARILANQDVTLVIGDLADAAVGRFWVRVAASLAPPTAVGSVTSAEKAARRGE